MIEIINYMQFCRLCLVKEKVNVPIFDNTNDDKQLFLKITQCLPVKVSPDDKLPKNICESCLHKVDSLYQFQNMTVNSEKQLVQWLKEVGIDISDKPLNQARLECTNHQQEQHSIHTDIVMKQEQDLDTLNVNAHTYQNQSYQDYNMTFSQMASDTASAFPQAEVSQPADGAYESDRGTQPDNSEDDAITGNRIAKEEVESEEDYDESGDTLEPTAFVGVPSRSVSDEERPGPSGLSKPGPNSGCTLHKSKIKQPNSNEKSNLYEELTIKEEPLDWEVIPPEDVQYEQQKSNNNSVSSYKLNESTCILCNKKLKGRWALIDHYLSHKVEKIKKNVEEINKMGNKDFFRCQTCMKEFVTLDLLEKHNVYHEKRPFLCEKCLKSFKQPNNFLVHMNSHQPNVEINKMQCKFCDFTTTFKIAYNNHVQSHNRGSTTCEICNKTFPARTWCQEHKYFHTGEKKFTCDECGKCFIYSRYLIAHKKSMHPQCFLRQPVLNECHICKKRYARKSGLQVHMKSHSGENVHLCDICGKSLTSGDKLQLHRRIHTGYKPYSCTECNKSFTKKDILTQHMRVHSGEKPFSCEICGKCFSQRSPLSIHKRYHTGERPYVCHLCNKGFVSKGILGIHLKQGKH